MREDTNDGNESKQMKQGEGSARIAVVGMGPRGLGALEALAARAQAAGRSLSVDVFDPFPAAGAGPNFDPDESPLCLLNIPMRDISIRPPGFSRCGSFADWLKQAPDPDAFPTRVDLGHYLEARYADLLDLGILKIVRHAKRVEVLGGDDEGWRLRVDGQWRGPYDEVLLTLGQPEVTPDDQWGEWQEHAKQSAGELAQAYQARRLAKTASDWTGKVVAIRGLGLSAFDVLRVLTVAQGGRFQQGRYLASGREPRAILPFSLDGKPPFPKPETEALDARFEPLPDETRAFEDAIAKAATVSPDAGTRLINAALVPAVTRILRQCGGEADAHGVSDWLETEWASPGSQETGGPYDTLRSGMALADGSCPPTVGYTVGQVWRKWQNELRAGYNPARTPADTAKAIIDFDEGLKRYSYGPPLSAAHELVGLIEADIVDLDLSADPDIDMTATGWNLKGEADSARASVMIDAVLPSPDLSSVTASLVSDLVAEGRLSTIAEGLAAYTAEDGSVIGKDGQVKPGLCLLGRLALGSVVAADSLHDCFGDAANRWAKGVIDRMG